ncbi:hypothetical protein D9M68_763450 [compost metagenome]
MHAILDLATGGQHQHRQGLAARAQARQHLETIEARQADIENRQGIVLAGQRQVGGHPVVQHVHCPACAFEGLGHARRQLRMVFDQQNSHRHLPPNLSQRPLSATQPAAQFTGARRPVNGLNTYAQPGQKNF